MIDELIIEVTAGNGGDGVVNFRREKFIPKGGPDGGDGGRGGDIFLKAIRDITVLQNYKRNPVFKAEDGENGMRAKKYGKSGKSKIIDVPLGSVVTNMSTKEKYDLTEEGMVVLVAAGGNGGLGNVHFKSSVNTTPKEATKGTIGQYYKLHIELKIIADLGLIGFPNAGKTTLLNTLTRAKGKIGSYKFTTLTASLGVYHQYVIADIPGLIEGAAQGKGLGHSFLRHISRARMLIHLIAMDEHSEDPLSAYKAIRKELDDYSAELTKKPEVIFLTKSDTVNKNTIESIKKKIAATQKTIFVVNKDDSDSLKFAIDGTINELKDVFNKS